ncbi:acyl-CoA thioesterase [Acetivibrio cellulolyticus]|uniref:acyl-CoA thioesterase n=1 Tax=Acetivibrio cellulolyticus TaxID=35830 RepID=UPI0002481BEA|nr:acyl-CoA thioesterase [Acetivibrio cellulolyticus]
MAAKTRFRVIYTEIDGMGIVHHSKYPLWFEKGRWDYLKEAGASNSQIAKRGLFLPLSEIECKFKSPAKYGDKIIVITKITSMSSVKIKFEYEVFEKERGKLLATGRTVHAWTNQKIEPINIVKVAPDIYLRLKQFSESQAAT